MTDIIELPSKVVSFTNIPSIEKGSTKMLCLSENGFLAILYSNYISIGIIECAPREEKTKYTFNPEKVIVDFNYDIVFNVSGFDHSINDKMTNDNTILNLLFETKSTEEFLDEKCREYCNIEWSPLDVSTNKSFLTVSRFDHRIIVLSYNNIMNYWQKEFDITDLYYKFYKETMLKSQLKDNIVRCTNFLEYIALKNDLKLIDFSWSTLVRQYKSQQYCLLTTLSYSRILTIWRIVIDQLHSHCEILHCARLNEDSVAPLNVKFCDISETHFLITIVDSWDQIKFYPFTIVSQNLLIIETLSPPIIIKQQMKYCQSTKIQWSMQLRQLLVGLECKLLIAKIILFENNTFETESAFLNLPSNCEISGLSIKNCTAYITSADGYLFGLKLSPNYINVELSQIIFQNTELNGDNEFRDIFVSPNSVYLGFLKLSLNALNSVTKLVSNIVFVSLVSESQALNILMNDNIPFSRKQDAIEDIRHLYCNVKQGLHETLKKIGLSEAKWDNSSLHRLQFVRYICIFFGYKMDVIKELSGLVSNDHLSQITKVRKLESIIIMKNISYLLDGFCELDNDEVIKDDCIFVLKVIRKLELLPKGCIPQTAEAVANKCIEVLKTKFTIDDNELQRYRDITEDIRCVTCGLPCQFNLFALKCDNNHAFTRCCKSLELCKNEFKKCRMCGATEMTYNIQDLSNWKLEIVNSNCPLCDGKLLNVNV